MSPSAPCGSSGTTSDGWDALCTLGACCPSSGPCFDAVTQAQCIGQFVKGRRCDPGDQCPIQVPQEEACSCEDEGCCTQEPGTIPSGLIILFSVLGSIIILGSLFACLIFGIGRREEETRSYGYAQRYQEPRYQYPRYQDPRHFKRM
jgi:hypothetical protein